MNYQILDQYGLSMSKTTNKYAPFIEGPLEAYIYNFRYAPNVQSFIDDINLAINGQFNQIKNPDWSAGLTMDSQWWAFITPTHFEIWHNSQDETQKQIIPLIDWKEILLSWKECLE